MQIKFYKNKNVIFVLRFFQNKNEDIQKNNLEKDNHNHIKLK